MIEITVVIPTHRPDRKRIARTLEGLQKQTLSPGRWEVILVDNASIPPLAMDTLPMHGIENLRLIVEPTLGLTAARRCGFAHAQAPLLVMVDDDNVLVPGFLESTLALFTKYSTLGMAGGPSRPEFATPPPPWLEEFHSLLALRDLGSREIISTLEHSVDSELPLYPHHAPIGAGMVLRREIAQSWSTDSGSGELIDRKGTALTSGGDNDLVFHALRTGWAVGYFPALALIHMIPSERMDPSYLGRLNYGIQLSWIQVLRRHHACPWPRVAPWTVPLRCARSWLKLRGWSKPEGKIRWAGACGRFQGRARKE